MRFHSLKAADPRQTDTHLKLRAHQNGLQASPQSRRRSSPARRRPAGSPARRSSARSSRSSRSTPRPRRWPSPTTRPTGCPRASSPATSTAPGAWRRASRPARSTSTSGSHRASSRRRRTATSSRATAASASRSTSSPRTSSSGSRTPDGDGPRPDRAPRRRSPARGPARRHRRGAPRRRRGGQHRLLRGARLPRRPALGGLGPPGPRRRRARPHGDAYIRGHEHYFTPYLDRSPRGVGVEVISRGGDVDASTPPPGAADRQADPGPDWKARDFRLADPDGFFIRITSPLRTRWQARELRASRQDPGRVSSVRHPASPAPPRSSRSRSRGRFDAAGRRERAMRRVAADVARD